MMGEEDGKADVAEGVTNGTKSPEAESQVGSKPKEEKDIVKEMDEDKKQEGKFDTDNSKEENEVKERKEAADEGKEVPGSDLMEEEKVSIEGEKKADLIEEADGSEEKLDKLSEFKEENMGAEEHHEEHEVGKDMSNEENEEAKESKEKGDKKRARGKSDGEKVKKVEEMKEIEQKTPAVIDRPIRERKSVERLVATIEKGSMKEFHIEKGRGTPLKDIPNVAFKLSRRKTDDTFKLLHMILFGRRAKAFQIKGNLSRFSGFVWHDNEEKQRMKVKEKFDKCVKEKLLEFCDVLDIPVARTSTRKEDVVARLLEFLVAPHATTTVLLAEKEQGKKRKRPVKERRPKQSSKSPKMMNDTSKKDQKKGTHETEDDTEDDNEEQEKENGLQGGSETENSEQSESEEKKDMSEDDSEEAEKPKKVSKKRLAKAVSSAKAKRNEMTAAKKSSALPKAAPVKSPPSSLKAGDITDNAPKVFSRKKKNDEITKKSSASHKPAAKEKSGKKAVKSREKPKEDKVKPSDDELRNAICDILKEVDFNTATFTDILKQLAKKFATDLTPRKSSIKLMIQDELTKLADEEDDEEDDEDDEETAEPAGRKVEV